jgi:hypothetical protein
MPLTNLLLLQSFLHLQGLLESEGTSTDVDTRSTKYQNVYREFMHVSFLQRVNAHFFPTESLCTFLSYREFMHVSFLQTVYARFFPFALLRTHYNTTHVTDNMRITVKYSILACSVCETHTILRAGLLHCWVSHFLEGRI